MWRKQQVMRIQPGEEAMRGRGGITLAEIAKELGARIRAKNELPPTYRANLPNGNRIWLLIYSRPTVARNMPIR